MKQLISVMLVGFLVIFCAGEALASRHAVLVYDADTGNILHEENGMAQRYPASLTKMMTLYLLFEQMKLGRLNLGTTMNVSALAASQPQTNISLRRGAKITVEQAIKALVVRSANDVAVVVAEKVGGSVATFAKIATNKARVLGMVHTRFKNPHGLPDNGQVTTAKDMALLGAALRRDFPQYFHYFTTKSFTYNGRFYGSHNRVVGRLKGVDGIKTGYINASGFNLVSSFKHEGSNIVAVVMGGNTAAERDNRMVALLQKMHAKLVAQRKNSPNANQFAAAPRPVLKPNLSVAQPIPTKTAENNVSFKVVPPQAKNANLINVSFNNANNSQNYISNATYQVPQKIGNGAFANVDKGWAVQIGVFREADSAKSALVKVARAVQSELVGAIAYVEYSEHGTSVLHRARLKNLSQQSANVVCQKLQKVKQDCFVTKIN